MSKRFRYDTLQDRETVVAYLENLTEGFRQGCMAISHKGEELLLEPQGLVGFVLEARASDDERRLTIKLRWKERAQGEAEDEPLMLKPGRETEDL